MTPEQRRRYETAVHSMQSAVAFDINQTLENELGAVLGPIATQRIIRLLKHDRVGINNTMADLGSLARLLVSKGVIAEEEYTEAIVVGAEQEAETRGAEVKEKYRLKANVSFI